MFNLQLLHVVLHKFELFNFRIVYLHSLSLPSILHLSCLNSFPTLNTSIASKEVTKSFKSITTL